MRSGIPIMWLYQVMFLVRNLTVLRQVIHNLLTYLTIYVTDKSYRTSLIVKRFIKLGSNFSLL